MLIPLEPLSASLDRDRVDAERNMRFLKEEKCLLGLPHEDIVERGPIQEVTSDFIHRNRIDLLVLGTHGRRGLNKFLLGSVAEELFRVATCPVLTVGAEVPEPHGNELTIRTVLFPTYFENRLWEPCPTRSRLPMKMRGALF